jgi:hypothetical protein
MFKKFPLVLFAAHLALASCAQCQSVSEMPPDVLPESVYAEPLHDDVHQRPFVSGHSVVPHTSRTRFESDGDCHQCNGPAPCVCGDKKAQRKAKRQYKYWGYPELFCERPHGSLMRSHLDAQIAAGMAAQMMLYRYDFFDTDQPQAYALKPAGYRSVSRIVDFASVSPTPIMIESTGDDALDAARRQTVIRAMSQRGFPVDEEQVVTLDRDPFGVSADEAALNHGAMLPQPQSASQPGNSGSGIALPILPLPVGVAQ